MRDVGRGILELFAEAQGWGNEKLKQLQGIHVRSKRQDPEQHARYQRARRKIRSAHEAELKAQRERRAFRRAQLHAAHAATLESGL